MKASELRTKTTDELKQECQALTKELFNLRMQRGQGQGSKPHLSRQVRLKIARIKTILCEMGTEI